MMVREIFDAVLNTGMVLGMLLVMLGLVWLIFLFFVRFGIKIIHSINEESRLCPKCKAERKAGP